jgi:release factor glutamine methyltransferase
LTHVKALLRWATEQLSETGCDTPALDARLLLQAAAGLTREDLILYPERKVEAARADDFRDFVARRAAREPVSRILGEREFYGRAFRVTPAVLDPRPDTETLVDAALAVMPRNATVLDVGTGSGAIVITLLAERPDATGTATDISAEALEVARFNAEALGVAPRLRLAKGCWFEPVDGRFDLVVSNPPYIPAGEIAHLSPDVRNFDPMTALAGGSDGLDPYREIAAGVSAHLETGGSLLVEIGAGQADDVEAIFTTAGLTPVRRHTDLGGHVRCLHFRRA